MKKQNGIALATSLILLLLLSFSFIIIDNKTYSSLKVNEKNNRINEVKKLQNTFILSLEQQKWIDDGEYTNEWLCQEFSCIGDTATQFTIQSRECSNPNYNECFEVKIMSEYKGVRIEREKYIKI